MNHPPRRTAMIITVTALAGIVLAGCGGDQSRTTTAVDTGVVTIQTDTVVTNTIPADTATGDANLNADIAAISAIAMDTLEAIKGGTEPRGAAALAQQMTTWNDQFDRAADRIKADVASSSGAQTLKASILAAATTASDAYRSFVDALAQAADSNDVAGLQAAVTTMKSALDAFMATLPQG